MDKKEFILRELDKIGLNNKIVQLEASVELQNSNNANLRTKSKEIIENLVKENSELKQENKKLKSEINELTISNQEIITRVPRFILKIFVKKDKLLLNKGTNDSQ